MRSNGTTFIINHYVRSWGHIFIYDETTLTESLKRAGFTQITSHNILESDDAEFRMLENITRYPKEFLQLETLTLEAVKRT